MMKRTAGLLAAPLLHALLSIIFLSVLSTDTSSAVILVWLLLLLVSNCAVTALTANGRWYMILSSIGVFIVVFILIALLRGLLLNQPDSGNEDFGIGLLLLILGLPISGGTLVLGTVQGVLLSVLLEEPIHRLKSAALGGGSKSKEL